MEPYGPRGKSPLARVEIPTRVLVVDEEPLIRWAICTALAAQGFDPVPAVDGAEAERLAGEWPPPRVAVMDCRFVNGAQNLLACIRARYPDCRFLIMTTRAHGMVGEGSSDHVEIIEKPFDLVRLVAIVGQLAVAS